MEFRKRVKQSDKDVRFRVPKEILKEIEVRAEKNGRSRNAEFLDRVVKSIEEERK